MQPTIPPLPLQQLLMGSDIDHRPAFKHNNPVRPRHRGHPMGGHQHRATTHELLDRRTHRAIGIDVEG